MSAFDILSSEFVDELPEEPRLAFAKIVERATSYLATQRSLVDETERSSWAVYETAEHTAMNVIIASAKRLAIDPFDRMQVPVRTQFSSADYEQFKCDLDHYLTQLLLDNSIRTRSERASVSETTRQKIRNYLNAIKTQIDEADMPESRRAALRDKLAEFETMLDKTRVPVFALARILMEVLSISCNVLALSDSQTFHRLVSQAFAAVAEAKSVEDERRQLPPLDPPALLMPPRRADDERKLRPKESYDLNEDIPF